MTPESEPHHYHHHHHQHRSIHHPHTFPPDPSNTRPCHQTRRPARHPPTLQKILNRQQSNCSCHASLPRKPPKPLLQATPPRLLALPPRLHRPSPWFHPRRLRMFRPRTTSRGRDPPGQRRLRWLRVYRLSGQDRGRLMRRECNVRDRGPSPNAV